MNLYDFDKTIYKKDCSIEFFKFCFCKCFGLIHFFVSVLYFILNKFGLISTKKFKEKFFSFVKKTKNIDEIINKFWNKQLNNINKNFLGIVKPGDIICSASPAFLVEPAIQKLSWKGVLSFCTNLNKNTGKIEGENLKGEEKRKLLIEKGYSSFENVYTDSLSDFPILDMTENKWIVCGEKIYKFGEQKPTFLVKIKYLFKSLRVKHYVKNGLIFLPLFFCGIKFDWKLIYLTFMGFMMFSFSASIIYIINDLVDREKDRKHKTKRKRPIASYMVKPADAIALIIVLAIMIMLISWLVFNFNLYILIILLCYIVLNLLYSFWLKNVAVVDVFALALCYLVRIYFGGALIDVGVSKWLYLTVLCASLYMGFGKRRNEFAREGTETRKVNKLYSYKFLDSNLYLCLAMCLIFYALWVINVRTLYLDRFNSILLQATIPLVFFIMMRYSLDIENKSSSGDPIEVLFADKFLIFICLVFIIIIFIAMYVPMPNVFRV